MGQQIKTCIDRMLPIDQLVEVADLATKERDTNAPLGTAAAVLPPHLERYRMAVLTVKEWRPGRKLNVRFLDGDPDVRAKVRDVAKEWSDSANVTFEFGKDPDAEIRITFRESGSWSLIGVDALGVPRNKPTMNFGWLTRSSPGNEYSAVVLHEFGHALACVHEHQNPKTKIPWDKEAVYRYYAKPPNRWSKEEVDRNIFQAYEQDHTQFSAFDRDSIMLYPIPRELTRGRYSVGWNRRLSTVDKDFIARVYPPEPQQEVELDVDGQPAEAAIKQFRQEDHFRFSVTQPGRHAIETTGYTDVVMGLYGPDDRTRLIAEDEGSGRGVNAKIDTILMAGAFFVRVRHQQEGGTGMYRVGVTTAV